MGYFDSIGKLASGEGNTDDWVDAAGAVTGGKLVGDMFGAGPKKPDNSGLDKANDDILADWSKSQPQQRTQNAWLGNYTPTELDPQSLAQLDPSAMGNIKTNPQYDQYEMQALKDLQDRADHGLTEGDQRDLNQLEGNANRQVAGRNGALQQSLASRGLGGGGMELVGSQMNAQEADNQAADAALAKAAMIQQNKQSATQALGNQASAMQAKSFGQQAQQAQAADAISKFNTNNKVQAQVHNNDLTNQAGMYNNQGRQTVSNNNVAGDNAFAQSQFTNKGEVAKQQYNGNVGKENQALAQYGIDKGSQDKQKGAIIGAAGSMGAAFLSDETEKKDIKPVSEDHVEDFLGSLSKPKTFEYKDQANGAGRRTGVMAQDLHSAAVQDRGDGKKQVDVGALLGDIMASLDYLNRKK